MTWQQLLESIENVESSGFDSDTTKRYIRLIVQQAGFDQSTQELLDMEIAVVTSNLREQLTMLADRVARLEATERHRNRETLFPD